MIKLTKFRCLLAVTIIITVIFFSCEKANDFCPGCPDAENPTTTNVTKDSCNNPIICHIQDSLSGVLNDHLYPLGNPPLPQPNQTQQISKVTETVNDTFSCEVTSYKSTSREYGAILVPNPAQIFPITYVYHLNSLLDGGNQSIRTGIGGRRTLTLFSGPWSKSATCGPQQDSIFNAISSLQQEIPKASQNTIIIVEEVYSAYQAAARFAASYNSWFFDIAGSVNYESSGYEHKYIVMVKASDFVIRASEPERAFDWFPNLTDYSVLGSYSPVYVSYIEYGKMLMLSIETNLSKSSISSALSAAFDGAFSSGKFDASGSYASIEAQSKITVQAVGGRLENVIGLISNGKEGLKKYLEETAKDLKGDLAQPLFVEFKFLRDNSVAKVVFATDEYKVKNCKEAGTGDYELKFAPTDDFVFLPEVTQGDVCLGHRPYEIEGQIQLFAKNEREIWARVKILEREGSQGIYGDTRAEAIKEVKLGTVPSEKGKILYFVNGDIQDITPWVLPSPDPHNTYSFDFNEPNSIIARMEAPNARDCWDDYPNDFPARVPDRNFVRIFFKNIVVRTKKP